MRGVQVLIIGLFTLSAMILLMGVLLEPITSFVVDQDAVKTLGFDDTATSIQNTVLRWIPLLFIGYLITWAGMWAFRRERRTEVRR